MTTMSTFRSQQRQDAVLHHIFGMDVNKRNQNMARIGRDEIIYLSGNAIVKFNVISKARTYYKNMSDNQLGCIVINTDRSLLFVGEENISNPKIFVMSLPDFALKTVLETNTNIPKKQDGITESNCDGDESGYSYLALSHRTSYGRSNVDSTNDKQLLCSISGKHPDMILTLWDWQNGIIQFQVKALGQCISCVSFSPYDNCHLTTAGKGHIKFWNITETFTGPKLEGSMGRFNKVDLCDINCVIHLPNGITLSGSETGHILLWEGRFLKYRLVSDNDKDDNDRFTNPEIETTLLAHNGCINFLTFIEDEVQVVSVGSDGFVKWWSYEAVANLVIKQKCANQSNTDICLRPTKTFQICQAADFTHVLLPSFKEDGSFLFLHDVYTGTMWKTDLDGYEIMKISTFHGHSIAGIDISPSEHLIVTCGMDASIFCWNFLTRTQHASIKQDVPCSCIRWVPRGLDSSERSFLVGFQDGCIRCFYISQKAILLRTIIRPHKTTVKDIVFNSEGNLLATIEEGNLLFLFSCLKSSKNVVSFNPIGFIHSEKLVTNLKWKEDSPVFHYSTADGKQVEVDLKQFLQTNLDATQRLTYLLPVDQKVVSTQDTNCNESSNSNCQGNLNFVSFDMNFSIITSLRNSIIYVFRILPGSMTRESTFNSGNSFFSHYEGYFEGSSDSLHGLSSIKVFDWKYVHEEFFETTEACNDYTLEEMLVKKCKDSELVNATKKKNIVRRIVSDIRKQYLNVLEMNKSLPNEIRLSKADLFVDTHLHGFYEDLMKNELEKVVNSQSAGAIIYKTEKNRFQTAFLDILEYDHFIVSAIASKEKVQSIPVLKLSSSFYELRDIVLKRIADNELKDTYHEETVLEADLIKNDFNINHSNESTNNIHDNSGEKPLSTFEARKIMRSKRKEAIGKHISEKPNDEDDPADVKAVVDATYNVGDWKLKVAKDYEVPERKQVNLLKKVQEMIILEESIFETKKCFNAKLQSLAKERVNLLKDINSKKERLYFITQQLGDNDLNASILKYDITEDQMSIKMLLDIDENYSSVDRASSDEEKSPNELSWFSSIFPDFMSISKHDRLCQDILDKDDLSMVEKEEIEEAKMSLLSEFHEILHDLDNSIQMFDDVLYDLRKRRFSIQTEIKTGEYKLSLILKEIEILRSFEEKDKILRKKYTESVSLKKQLTENMKEYKALLDNKKTELENWMTRDAHLTQGFDQVVPKNYPYREILYHMFTNKQKRIKFEESDNDSEDFEDNDVYDDDDWSNDGTDGCPDGCSNEIYNTVVDFKRKRIVQEKELFQLQREIDNLTRSRDRLHKKEMEANKVIKSVEEEMRSFQREKQFLLNELSVVIPITSKQMYLWDSQDENRDQRTIPYEAPLSKYTLFNRTQFENLRERIRYFHNEIKQNSSQLKSLEIEKYRYEKEKVAKERYIQKQNDLSKELQILKFGQLFDIEELDNISSMSIEKIHSDVIKQIQLNEKEYECEINELMQKEEDLKSRLKNITNENTSLLNQIAKLSERQMELESQFAENEKNSQMILSDDDMAPKLAQKRKELKSTIGNQIKEIEQLKKDINFLKRKDCKMNFG